jgi:hypothetical protein
LTLTDKSSVFVAFSDAVEAAIATSELRLVQRVVAAGHDDWRAAAWMLERRWPSRYSQRLDLALARDVPESERPWLDGHDIEAALVEGLQRYEEQHGDDA